MPEVDELAARVDRAEEGAEELALDEHPVRQGGDRVGARQRRQPRRRAVRQPLAGEGQGADPEGRVAQVEEAAQRQGDDEREGELERAAPRTGGSVRRAPDGEEEERRRQGAAVASDPSTLAPAARPRPAPASAASPGSGRRSQRRPKATAATRQAAVKTSTYWVAAKRTTVGVSATRKAASGQLRARPQPAGHGAGGEGEEQPLRQEGEVGVEVAVRRRHPPPEPDRAVGRHVAVVAHRIGAVDRRQVVPSAARWR